MSSWYFIALIIAGLPVGLGVPALVDGTATWCVYAGAALSGVGFALLMIRILRNAGSSVRELHRDARDGR